MTSGHGIGRDNGRVSARTSGAMPEFVSRRGPWGLWQGPRGRRRALRIVSSGSRRSTRFAVAAKGRSCRACCGRPVESSSRSRKQGASRPTQRSDDGGEGGAAWGRRPERTVNVQNPLTPGNGASTMRPVKVTAKFRREQRGCRIMARKRAFISFDFDNDSDLRDNLVAQSKHRDSPFSVVDCSLREPYDERWRQKVRGIIRNADLTIVICGEHTDKAMGDGRAEHRPGSGHAVLSVARPFRSALRQAGTGAADGRDAYVELAEPAQSDLYAVTAHARRFRRWRRTMPKRRLWRHLRGRSA